jgi:hypothetical protein
VNKFYRRGWKEESNIQDEYDDAAWGLL